MMQNSDFLEPLLRNAASGDGQALGELFEHHRIRLSKMIRLRLDRRLKSRVNPSDVLQETFLEASKRLSEYIANPDVPFFIWLRFLTGQKIAQFHRHHLGVQARNAAREISVWPHVVPAVTSAALAAKLVGRLASPSAAMQKAELRQQLLDTMNSMEPIDREILAMRHFEQLDNREAAEVLGLSPTAASNRYVRALVRLRDLLGNDDSLLDEL